MNYAEVMLIFKGAREKVSLGDQDVQQVQALENPVPQGMGRQRQIRYSSGHRSSPVRPIHCLGRNCLAIAVEPSGSLLEENDGLGVFLNPDEGKEIMSAFATLLDALRKKGEGLTEDEGAAVRGFIVSPAVRPMFVRRVPEERESVRTAFLLTGNLPGYWLDYLLRSRKGHFYRKRYPTLGLA